MDTTIEKQERHWSDNNDLYARWEFTVPRKAKESKAYPKGFVCIYINDVACCEAEFDKLTYDVESGILVIHSDNSASSFYHIRKR